MKPFYAIPLLAIAACREDHYHAAPCAEAPRYVSIEVEVYDPVTNLVWENVSVRVVEAWHEYSGLVCTSPYEDWFLTDAAGRVLFDEATLAWVEVGFRSDQYGALLFPCGDEDEASVTLEVDAVGFVPVIVEVPLRWDMPDVFVAVPFD
jgi:hypothetical protein